LGSTPKERHEKAAGGYPWGDEWPPKGKAGNYGDMTFHGKFPNLTEWIEGYTDGFATTAQVGGFAPNSFGIYDLGGNVWEWCEDLFAPGGPYRVLRGASWHECDYRTLRSSHRRAAAPGSRGNGDGFRCVIGVAGR
jgi:formylglycine-generating enzyme required for sulfatase activity